MPSRASRSATTAPDSPPPITSTSVASGIEASGVAEGMAVSAPRVRGVPEAAGGRIRRALAVRVAAQFELQAPGGEAIDPARAGGGAVLDGERLTQHRDAVALQVRDGGIQVVHVEGEVVAADVAVSRRRARLVGRV